jgi:hypothetical protein
MFSASRWNTNKQNHPTVGTQWALLLDVLLHISQSDCTASISLGTHLHTQSPLSALLTTWILNNIEIVPMKSLFWQYVTAFINMQCFI